MSAAEVNTVSPLQLSSGVVAMAVVNSNAMQGESGAKAQASASARKFVVATAAPKLQDNKALVEELEIDMEEVVLEFNRALDAKAPNADANVKASIAALNQTLLSLSKGEQLDPAKLVQDIKTQLTQLESATGLKVFGQMNEQLDAVEPPPSDSESSSFGGMSSSDLKDMQVLLATMMSLLQGALSQKQQTELNFNTTVSSKTLIAIETDNAIADQNADDQAALAEKQRKISFWSKVGMWTASALAVAAVFIIAGPVAAAVLAAIVVAQMTGGLDKMFSSLDGSPILKMAAEMAFVVAVTALTGGAAAFVELSAEVGVEMAATMMVEAAIDAVTTTLTSALEAATTALETVMTATMESVGSALSAALESASAALQASINNTIKIVSDSVKAAMDTLIKTVTSAVEAFESAASSASQASLESLSQSISNAMRAFSEAMEASVSKLDTVAKTVADFAKSPLEAITKLFTQEASAVTDLSDEAIEKAFNQSMKLGKTVAFLTATQTLMSTDVIPLLSEEIMKFFFVMLGLDNESKAAHIMQQVLQLTLMLTLAMSMVAGPEMTTSKMMGDYVGRAGTGLMAGSGLFSLTSNGLNIWGTSQSYKIADLQKTAAMNKANTDQMQFLNATNLDWMKETQNTDRKQIEDLGENCRAAWQYFGLINQAVARALAY